MAAVLVLAGCGSTSTTDSASGPASTSPTPDQPPAGKVAPRWESVATFSGSGDGWTAAFEIAPHAIQWRVTAACKGPALRVALEGDDGQPLAEPECPGRAFGFSIRTGPHRLTVSAAGDWDVAVAQQLDTPIEEPPLPGMSERTVVASGPFYGIDQKSGGRAELHRLPDGTRALRFDPFHVTANTDLFVWLSDAEKPQTSKDAFDSDHVQIAELQATAGPQNYVIPGDIPAGRLKSVVIWCEPVRTAYAAASLSG